MLFRYFDRKIQVLFAATMAVSALSIYFTAQLPACMDRITEAFDTGDEDLISGYTELMTYYALASFVMAVATGVLGARVSQVLSGRIREQQFRQILRMSSQDVDRFSAQSLSTRAMGDVEVISGFMSALTVSGFTLPLTLVIVIPAMLERSVDWSAAVGGLLLAGGAAVLVTLVRMAPFFNRTQYLYDDLNRTIVEYLDGLMVIRAYGGTGIYRDGFRRSSDNLYANDRTIQKFLCVMGPITSVMAVLVPLVIYAVSLYLLPDLGRSEQRGMYSSMIQITMYALIILSALTQTMWAIGIMYPKYKSQKERVDEVLDFTPVMGEGASEGPEPEGRVEFRNVTFTYPGSDRPVIRNMSFSVEPGEKVAFVGSTASGKTTILNLVQRMYDADSGEVLVDGTDVREYTFSSLRGRMSYAMQRPDLFTGTIRDNVRFGPRAENATDEEVESALRDCGCDRFLGEMPLGADTVLTERGKNLSGGQKQRISLARAVCSRSRLYMLDDQFSALDAVTEAEVRESLIRRLSGSTVLTVTQKVLEAMGCDTIYVVEDGGIVAHGSHEELLASCEYYREMCRIQADRGAVG